MFDKVGCFRKNRLELGYLKGRNTPTTTQSEEGGETKAVYCGKFGSKRFHRQNH